MGVGLGMKAVALDPYASPGITASASVSLLPNLASCLPFADFLTIHTPLIASTFDLISEKGFSLMKRTAKILNVARGMVLNEAALLCALNASSIAGAGIDVFTSEAPTSGSAAEVLCRDPKVVATTHLNASKCRSSREFATICLLAKCYPFFKDVSQHLRSTRR